MAPQRRSSRREFLQGQAAVDRLLDVSQGPAQPAEASHRPPTAFLVQYGRRAMACEFQIFLNAGQYSQAAKASLAALDLIDQLEDQLSVYREHSEVSRLNRLAHDAPLPVEPGLFDLLTQSLELHHATGGAFDITASPLSRAWGFFRRAGRVPSEEELAEARARVGSRHIELHQQERTVHFTKPGVELSLNSIGKGYALDRAGDLLLKEGVGDFLFHGGQSSVLAAGSHAAQAGRGWTVGLRHPLRPNERLAEFCLRDQALGTSGSGTQFFHHQGKRYGHVIDPRTGLPATGVFSATVIAGTAAEADALATAFYVMGPKATEAYCTDHPEIGVLLVCPGERAGSIHTWSFGFDDDQWRRLDDG